MQECSELFVKSFTANGYCCTFNYFRPDSGNETLAKIKYPNDVGTPAELTLLLNTSTKDYFLTDRSFIGYTFQIFYFADFPDPTNGGSVKEAFISPGSDIEFRMSASVQTATSELGVFNVNQRRCFLYGEALNEDTVRYSSDECMTHCKISGVLRLCGCIPYYTPADLFKADNSNISHCTLAHLECLERKKVILHTYSLYSPFGDDNASNQALDCRKCVPLCNFNTYTLHKVIGPLKENYLLPANRRFLKMIPNDQPSDKNFEYSYENLVSLIRKSEDVSLVKLYFDSMYATQYSKRSLYTWYEMLSNIGGILGIFIGCSLISAFEVFYIFGFKLIAKFRKHYKVKSGQNNQIKIKISM
ncbi:pickpocket protein 28-like [Rhagoletis pomonella]|uniref:pickpocket protein 28-like n=1 Tax=Rhagoletis pomonella TaxID=28610 RepID=UPI0017806AAB|nr:pickpocket protein 28-like [Rhagoletis pomonella]